MSIAETIRNEWEHLSSAAQDHIRRTRPDLLNQWGLSEAGYQYDIITAADAAEALAAAKDNVDRANYDVSGTLWIEVGVRNTVTGESDNSTVKLDAEEPDCEDGEEHDWRSPYSVLGGFKENPGVWGHGGGVIIREVCAHCGQYRITDSWAQRPDTGEQGLESVEYEDADDASLAYVERRKAS